MKKLKINIGLWMVLAVMLFHYVGIASTNPNALRSAFDSIVTANKKNENNRSSKENNYLLILSGDYIEGDYTYLRIDSYSKRLQLIEQRRQTEYKQLNAKLEKINKELIALGKKDRVYFLVGENHTIPVRLKEYYGINEKNAFKHFFTKNKGKEAFFDKEKWDESVQLKNASQLIQGYAAYKDLTYTKLIKEVTENQENILVTSQFNFILAKRPEYNASNIKAIGRYGTIQVRRAKGDSKEIKEHVKNYLNNNQLKSSLFSLADALGEYAKNGLATNTVTATSYCEGFEYLDELDGEDIATSVKELESAISNIESGKGKDLAKGVFNHFIGNNLLSKLSKDKLQALEDKLQLLSNQLDKHIVVQFLKLNTNNRYSDNLLTRLAEQSLEKAKTVTGKEVIFMVFSHSNYESILWESRDKVCYNFGFAQTSPIADVKTGLQSGLAERILNVYKEIEKPLNVYGIVRLTDGSIVKLYRNSIKNIKGYSLINGLVLLESPHFKVLQEIIAKKPIEPDEDDFKKDDEYREALRKYRKEFPIWLAQYNKVKLEGMQEDRQKMAAKDKGYKYFKNSDGEIRIRENYITPEAYKNDLLISYSQFHYDNLKAPWTTGLVYHLSDTYKKLDAKVHLLDDMSVSTYIYQTLDAASLVLAPVGLDFIPDLAGFVYASFIDKDGVQAGSYFISLGAVGYFQYLKMANKYAYKSYKAIGVLDNSGNVVSVSSKLDNYVPKPNEKQLSSIIAKSDTEAAAILKQDLPFYYIGNIRLSGPILDDVIAATFNESKYINRQIESSEIFYKYHGINNRTGRKITWFTNSKYTDEEALRKGLAIRDDWGVDIKYISEFEAPKGTWVSEGAAASQGGKYIGGDYQAIVTNVPNAWIRRTDAAFGSNSLLKSGGGFVDDILENDYRKYLARKIKQGKEPRERLDWKEAREYWLNDSPLARGNAFNKKAVDNDWYDYNEVTLANGKRVDSYQPPENGNLGEIVSRKATSLEDIQLSTFEKYLKEMKIKYSPGTAINAPKYGNDLKGQVLEGKLILEIPENNRSFSQLQEYIDLAKNNHGIEVRFRSE